MVPIHPHAVKQQLQQSANEMLYQILAVCIRLLHGAIHDRLIYNVQWIHFEGISIKHTPHQTRGKPFRLHAVRQPYVTQGSHPRHLEVTVLCPPTRHQLHKKEWQSCTWKGASPPRQHYHPPIPLRSTPLRPRIQISSILVVSSVYFRVSHPSFLSALLLFFLINTRAMIANRRL